jgi:ribosomal protein S27AE
LGPSIRVGQVEVTGGQEFSVDNCWWKATCSKCGKSYVVLAEHISGYCAKCGARGSVSGVKLEVVEGEPVE